MRSKDVTLVSNQSLKWLRKGKEIPNNLGDLRITFITSSISYHCLQ